MRPQMYDLCVSSACICRDDAFRLLSTAAEYRRDRHLPRAVVISKVRWLLECARTRDGRAREYGLKLP